VCPSVKTTGQAFGYIFFEKTKKDAASILHTKKTMDIIDVYTSFGFCISTMCNLASSTYFFYKNYTPFYGNIYAYLIILLV
jgi:hypothetical protein